MGTVGGGVEPQLKFMDWKEDKGAVAVLCAVNIISSGEMSRGGRGSTGRQKGSNDGGGGSRNGMAVQ